MKIISTLLTSVFLSLSSIAAYAADMHYTIFVDAGSTGSRLHIFQYENAATMPVVTDIFSESVKPGLSSFADHPELAGQSLKKLFDDATQFLQKNGTDPHVVSVSVLATAGMRLLSDDKQQAIYTNVNDYLKTNYTFAIGQVETISGKTEGVYDWLTVNYLAGNFQNQHPTVGSIDMGGASTQIAFATQDRSHQEDEVVLQINNQTYTIFSKSFLGLGLDQSFAAMNMSASANLCYPHQYASNASVGDFNFASCSEIYSKIIQQANVAQQMISTKGQSFIAYSGIYYPFNFLEVDKTPERSVVEKRIQAVCNKPWQELQKDYPQVVEKYLAANCANSVYDDRLLYDVYQLQDGQLTVTTQINHKDIDWTLGAALVKVHVIHHSLE